MELELARDEPTDECELGSMGSSVGWSSAELSEHCAGSQVVHVAVSSYYPVPASRLQISRIFHDFRSSPKRKELFDDYPFFRRLYKLCKSHLFQFQRTTKSSITLQPPLFS